MFDKNFDSFVCEGDTITCEVGAFTCTATVYRDDNADKPDERDDGFWPSRDPEAAGYVLPENFDAQQAIAEKVMMAWMQDEWWYCGVAVTIACEDVELTGQYEHALWGIECNYPDSKNEYLREVANDLLHEALAGAREKLARLCTHAD